MIGQRPPLGLAPPLVNHGSATDFDDFYGLCLTQGQYEVTNNTVYVLNVQNQIN